MWTSGPWSQGAFLAADDKITKRLTTIFARANDFDFKSERAHDRHKLGAGWIETNSENLQLRVRQQRRRRNQKSRRRNIARNLYVPGRKTCRAVDGDHVRWRTVSSRRGFCRDSEPPQQAFCMIPSGPRSFDYY